MPAVGLTLPDLKVRGPQLPGLRCGGLAVAMAWAVVAMGAGFCHIDIRQPPLPNPFPYA